MKKYDFLLLGLYTLPVLVLIIGMWTYIQIYVKEGRKCLEYVSELYSKPVTQVIIQDTGVKYRVIRDSTRKIDFAGSIEFKGRIKTKDIDGLKMSGDTLYLGELNYTGNYFTLYVGDRVKVDTINAPKTQLVGLSVTQDSVRDGF